MNIVEKSFNTIVGDNIMKNDALKRDMIRYANSSSKMPAFQKYYRKCQSANGLMRLFYKLILKICTNKRHIEISADNKIGAGLYVGHAYCITIGQKAVIGENCNIHKGVTIGQENRGPRKGSPTIKNRVWIGINSTVVGNISVGDDVIIAPNSYVNCDIPSHYVVFGNPCVIKHKENATESYVNNMA